MSNADHFLKKVLGEDFLESLSKTEIWKPGSKSVNDVDDMWHGLKLVPRTVIAFLVRELSGMQVGENKRIELPMAPNSFMVVTKYERDQYSGDIEQDNKKVTEFKFRSLPGVGLVLMSAFELYSQYLLEGDETSKVVATQAKPELADDADSKIQRLIDERLELHDLIGKVVDKKLMHKEAVHQLVLSKLTEAIKLIDDKVDRVDAKTAEIGFVRAVTNGIEKKIAQVAEKAEMAEFKAEVAKSIAIKAAKKAKPLQAFLEKKKQKVFSIPLSMTKGELIGCPDCGKNIFDGTVFSGCICLGQDMDRKVFIKKSENSVNIRFSRGWDPENIEMLLEVLKKK
jgi:hypothetical protein